MYPLASGLKDVPPECSWRIGWFGDFRNYLGIHLKLTPIEIGTPPVRRICGRRIMEIEFAWNWYPLASGESVGAKSWKSKSYSRIDENCFKLHSNHSLGIIQNEPIWRILSVVSGREEPLYAYIKMRFGTSEISAVTISEIPKLSWNLSLARSDRFRILS